jgi:putative ABC transport system permease protein
MRIPLVRGRLLDRNDVHEAAVHKVVVSEAFAKRAFPNRDPIGQRIRYSGGDQRPWDEKRAIWSVDKDQPIVRIATMDVRIAATEAQRHFALIVFEAFALAALALAAIGIYGVLAGNVAERIREIGVRSALGASPTEIYGLIMRQGMTLTIVGVLLGAGGAVLTSRALTTMLFGVSALDDVTYVGVIAVLLGIAAIACWLPASRAARVDPSVTLRAE